MDRFLFSAHRRAADLFLCKNKCNIKCYSWHIFQFDLVNVFACIIKKSTCANFQLGLSVFATHLRYTAKRRVCKLPCLRGISAQTHTYACKHIVVFPQTSWDLKLLCWQIKTPKHPKTIFHSEDGTQVFVYSLLHSITPSSVCLTFHTHGLIFYLVALQICKLMPQLSAEAACGVEFIKPACPPARLCVRTSHNDGIPS